MNDSQINDITELLPFIPVELIQSMANSVEGGGNYYEEMSSKLLQARWILAVYKINEFKK